MRLLDIDLGEPGEVLAVTATGDLVLVSGLDSLSRWLPRAAVTSPGSLLHRPEFGVGVERYLGRGVSALPQLAASIRGVLGSDRRVAEAVVTAERPSPGVVHVAAEVLTVDDQRSLISLEF